MIPIPASGTLLGVRNTEAVAEIEGVREVTITIAPGREVRPLPEGDRYLGFIIADGEEAAEVEDTLREAHSVLSIDISRT